MRIVLFDQVRHRRLFIQRHTENFRYGLLPRETFVFIVKSHLGSQHLNGIFAIRAIHDSEGRREIDPAAEFAQHEVGERVKGPAGDLAAAVVDQHAGAPKHLLGGAARKSEQQDGTRVDPDIDEVRDAIDQSPGFAGAGAGNDQQRALYRAGRLILSLVKLLAVVEL